MAGSWTISDYDRLFAHDPPTQSHAPTRESLDELTTTLGRSAKAVLAQWDDARSAVLNNQTEASGQLIGYLRRRGWLG